NGRANRVKAEVQVEPAVLDTYVGRYQRPGEVTATLARDGTHLTWQPTYQQDGRTYVFDPETLFAESATKFFDKTSAAREITFVKDEAGKVVGLGVRESTTAR